MLLSLFEEEEVGPTILLGIIFVLSLLYSEFLIQIMDNESTRSDPQTSCLYSDEFFRCNLMMRNLMGLQIKMNFEAG